MTHFRTFARAEVTYRASAATGGEVELRRFMDPAAATVADAWARLTALRADLDPHTLEIEIRRAPRRASARAKPPAPRKAAAPELQGA